MTWSIVARCRASGRIGVAVATRFFAVGAVCPAGAGGIGAVASQALVNPFLRSAALDQLAAGAAPDAIVRDLMAADLGRDQRQVHLIDAAGQIAQHTGQGCVPWAGHVAGSDASVAGNMLAGPAVIADTLAAFEATDQLPLAERLLAALDAGEAAGGDKRGRQSAALMVWHTERWAELDIRADDHAAPLEELRRLYAVSNQHWAVFRRHLATAANPTGTLDRTVILAELAAHQAAS